MAAAAAVSDDVLLEIFARVRDPVDLLRCAGACRRWLRLIAADGPSFLLLRRAAGLTPPPEEKNNGAPSSSNFILGAFYQNAVLVSALASMDKQRKNRLVYPPQFARLVRSPRLSEAFFPDDDDDSGGVFSYAKPLASRRGLLLARVMPTPLDRRELHLAVCHPLIGHRSSTRLVPPPPHLALDPDLFGADLTGYALLPTDHRDHQQPPEFRVLITAVHAGDREDDKPAHHYAYCYSSVTSTWRRSAPIDCPAMASMRAGSSTTTSSSGGGGLTMSGPRAGVVDAHGTAHWLYRDETSFYTLDVAIKTAGGVPWASLTKLPIPAEQGDPRARPRLQPPFPCVSREGKLSLARLKANGRVLELWTKRDDSRGWARSGQLIREEGGREARGAAAAILGFAESGGALLVQNGGEHGGLCTLGLESKEMAPVGGHGGFGWWPLCVCDWFRCRGHDSCEQCAYNGRVLYEMDWPSYLGHLCHSENSSTAASSVARGVEAGRWTLWLMMLAGLI